MKIFGITGSIATGKSTVTNYLRDKGYLVVDSDKLAYDALTIDEVLNNNKIALIYQLDQLIVKL
ncbi:MAG: dephospho-CoA kinase [Thomasclavelia spiroformis]